jgi:hypothetical protein
MPATPTDTFYRTRRDVRFRVVDGEAVVLRQDAAEALVINEVGARILQLLDGHTPIGRVADRLVEEYEVGRDQAMGDLREFVADLSNVGIVEPVADGA